MANLKGSIKEIFTLNGESQSESRLLGSIKKVYSLLGSVESFLRSLTIRIFIQPIASVTTSVSVDRYLKAQITGISNVYTRFMAFRNIKDVNFTAKSNIIINMKAIRNIKININARPIFGIPTTLDVLDSMTLDEMDNISLGDLEFSEGIRVNVIKKFKADILGIAEINSALYIIRYNTLDDWDTFTLDQMDSLILNELDEATT